MKTTIDTPAPGFITDDDGYIFKPFEPIEAGEEPPPIPLSLVPESMRAIVKAKADELEVPIVLPLSVCLGVVATATQSRWSVKVKQDFEVPTNVYLAVPADPGERKTPTMRPLLAPLIEWEKNERERAKLEDSKHETKRRLLQKKIGKLEREAEKDGADVDALAAQIDATKTEIPPEIIARRMLADDATPEQLSRLLGAHRGNLAILSDEGAAILRTISGAYNNGRSNIDAILKAFDGGFVRIDRSNGHDVMLDSARLTMCLLIQKGVAEDLLSNREFVERGLVQRFMWMIPSNSKIGDRTGKGPATPGHVISQWHQLVTNLLQWAPQAEDGFGTTTHSIGIQAGALSIWDAYTAAIERSIKPMDEQDPRRQVRLKWPSQVLRLAGLIHCADFVSSHTDRAPHERAIGEDTMKHAVALGSILLDHTDAAMCADREDRVRVRMKRVLKHLHKLAPEPDTPGNMWRSLRNARAVFPEKETFDEAVEALFNAGYIAWRKKGSTNTYRLTEAALFGC